LRQALKAQVGTKRTNTEALMDTTTLIIVIVILLLLFGGGGYGYSRRR
jgi:hypothetical protein